MAYSKGLHQIEVVRLELDPNNPRLPERLIDAPEHEVLNWMLTDATLTDLMASIVENGFFAGEALIGINDANNDGKVIIVEGNRRLASVKLLINPSKSENKTKTVQSLSIETTQKDNLPVTLPIYVVDSRGEVENYLGFRHVSGVKQWPVIAKARYLHFLYSSRAWNSGIYIQLAKEIGSKSQYVRRLVIGYMLFELIKQHGFFDLDNLSEENFDLSLINDAATKYSDIADYMGVNKDIQYPLALLKLDEFRNVYEWLYKRNEKGETRLGESRNLPVLNKILATPEAKVCFIIDNYTLEDAAAVTTLADDNIRWHLQNARISMLEAQKLVHNIKSPNRSDLRIAEEIRNSADTIRREMSSKFIDNETQL